MDLDAALYQNTQQFFTAAISPTTVVLGDGPTADFSTFSAWLSVEPKPGAAYTVEIDGTVTEVTNVTLNQNYFQGQLLIKPVAGQEHRGKPGTGARIYFDSGTKTTTFQLGAIYKADGSASTSSTPLEDFPHTIIQDLEIEGNSSTINTFSFISLQGNYNKKTIQRCLIHGSRKFTTNNDHGCIVIPQGLTNITIQSNIIYNATSVNMGSSTQSFAAIQLRANVVNSKYIKLFQNNTIYDISTDGVNISARGIIYFDATNVKVYNNIVNNITNSAGGSAACYNNSSPANASTGGNIADDTSSPDSLNNITVDFVNTGSEDFHITNSTNNQTNVIGQGDTTIDLLGYQDIDGDYRSNVTPDIGADEYNQFFVNTNTFYLHEIPSAEETLTPNRIDNTSQFFSHALELNLSGNLYQNTQQFFTSAISPTTVVIGDGPTADFSTFTAWLSVEPKPGAAYTIEIDGTVTEVTAVNLNKTYFHGQLLIKPVDGQEHRGKPGTGARIYFNSGFQIRTFTLGTIYKADGSTPIFSDPLVDYPHTIIQDLEIEGNSSTIDTFYFLELAGNYTKKTVQRCLIHGSRKSATNNNHGCVVVNSEVTNITIQSNIIYNATSVNAGGTTKPFGAIFILSHNSTNSKYTKLIQNNTVYDISTNSANIPVRGISYPDSANIKVYNNIVNNITNSAAGTATCYDNSSPANASTGSNIADDTSSPDSLNNITVDFVNTTSGSEDFHITNSTNNQTNVIGQGDTTIDLLGYQDIDGDYRSNVTPDIGADEYDQFFVNTNTFYLHEIPSPQTLTPNRIDNTSQFFTNELNQTVFANRIDNTSQFFTSELNQTAFANRIDNTSQFFTNELVQTLTSNRIDNISQFYNSNILLSANQNILLENTNQFYSADLAKELVATRVDNTSQFFTNELVQTLFVNRFDNSSTIFFSDVLNALQQNQRLNNFYDFYDLSEPVKPFKKTRRMIIT